MRWVAIIVMVMVVLIVVIVVVGFFAFVLSNAILQAHFIIGQRCAEALVAGCGSSFRQQQRKKKDPHPPPPLFFWDAAVG